MIWGQRNGREGGSDQTSSREQRGAQQQQEAEGLKAKVRTMQQFAGAPAHHVPAHRKVSHMPHPVIGCLVEGELRLTFRWMRERQREEKGPGRQAAEQGKPE